MKYFRLNKAQDRLMMNLGYKYISTLSIFCFFAGALPLCSQECTLQINFDDVDTTQQLVFADNNRVFSYVDSMQRHDHQLGYLGASVDEWKQIDSTTYQLSYRRGVAYKFGKINFDNEAGYINSISDQNIKNLSNKPLSTARITGIYKKMITQLENSGYPFARIYLDSIEIKEDLLEGVLVLDRSRYITIDSISRKGNLILSRRYLQKYLGLQKGKPFNRSKIKEIKSRLGNLSFITVRKEPTIKFVNDKAIVILDLDKRRSSHFDFIIGLLQNDGSNGQRYTITGSFTAEMINKLSYGERFFLSYERLQPEVLEFKTAFDVPYILSSDYGVSMDFDLYRNANTFLDAKFNFGIQYYLEGRDYLRVSGDYKTSRLLELDTTNLFNNKALPTNLDLSYSGLGLSFQFSGLDYIFNPRKGYDIKFEANLGYKNIIKNNAILGFEGDGTTDFSQAYDSLDLRTYQLGHQLHLDYYQPIASNISIKTSMQSAWLYNEKKLFENELLRLGGNKLLRGFDEQTIRSSFYTVLTAELRFILAQQNNNFTLALPFIDYGISYNPFRDDGQKWDRPIGVGVGMNFETKAGLFSFAVAAGRQLGNPWDFGNLKIHFGYVNLF